MKGAALAACVEKVDFLLDCNVDGVNDGDSTFRVFLPALNKNARLETPETALKMESQKRKMVPGLAARRRSSREPFTEPLVGILEAEAGFVPFSPQCDVKRNLKFW